MDGPTDGSMDGPMDGPMDGDYSLKGKREEPCANARLLATSNFKFVHLPSS